MLPRKLAFVDIETSGSSPISDRIIEIGIIRVEDGEVVRSFESLINPEMPIHEFITQLTGISQDQVEEAPTFGEISDEIYELLEDTIFVAHNVRFDYGFVRNELRRMGYTFSTKQLCTVKLARKLYPGHQRYNLDSIIERHNITCPARHRALGDTQVIYNFYNQALSEHGESKLSREISKLLKTPSVPITISQTKLDQLPEGCGVYIFRDKENTPLYIGKSVNLRDRVYSHFSSDYLTQTDSKLAREAYDVEVIETPGELGALLKEASLVKELQPIYNKQLRRMSRVIAVMEHELEGYKSLQIIQFEALDAEDISKLCGIFRSVKQAKEFIRDFGKEHNLCDKYLGLEKTKGSCFAYQLNSCKGACVREETTLSYNLRFTQAISKYKVKSWPFGGPVMIKEEGVDSAEGYIVDKWCLLGKVNGVIPEMEDLNYTFDYDTYEILKRFLLNNKLKNNQTIMPFTTPSSSV